MHIYRTHLCGALRAENEGQSARLSGWIDRKRDHGNLLFIDLRDNDGITQLVVDTGNPLFEQIERLPVESVITATGKILRRSAETINATLPTGEIELSIEAGDIGTRATHVEPDRSLETRLLSDT